MSRERDMEVAVGAMKLALEDISRSHDCLYSMDPEADRPKPCPCPPCTAQRTLEVVEGGWRYEGARSYRTETNPREKRIVAAWKKLVDDKTLGMVLSEGRLGNDRDDWEMPTPRDWYVATSVVQWLATNVGMEVLRQAGFTYKREDKE